MPSRALGIDSVRPGLPGYLGRELRALLHVRHRRAGRLLRKGRGSAWPFGEVTNAGHTVLQTVGQTLQLLAGFLLGYPPILYEISTTAQYTGLRGSDRDLLVSDIEMAIEWIEIELGG